MAVGQRVPAGCSCSALRQAARYATRMYDDALVPVGLGINQYSILANLERVGPKHLQELADMLVMDRSTLGHVLRPLQARGLLTITVSPDDKRHRLIELTAEGAALLKAAQPHWCRAQLRFEQAFGAARAAELRTVLAGVTSLRFADASSEAIELET